MNSTYILIAVIAVILLVIIEHLIIEFWDDIVKFLKTITSCFLQIITVIIIIVLIGLVCNWLFKDCTPKDPDSINYDYDPGLHRRY